MIADGGPSPTNRGGARSRSLFGRCRFSRATGRERRQCPKRVIFPRRADRGLSPVSTRKLTSPDCSATAANRQKWNSAEAAERSRYGEHCNFPRACRALDARRVTSRKNRCDCVGMNHPGYCTPFPRGRMRLFAAHQVAVRGWVESVRRHDRTLKRMGGLDLGCVSWGAPVATMGGAMPRYARRDRSWHREPACRPHRPALPSRNRSPDRTRRHSA
jgi:hypothetical protein